MKGNPTVAGYEAGLTVTRRVEAAEGVVLLTLRHPDGEPLPEWQPGAHVALLLDNGLVRHYSLCGAPGDRTAWRIGVLRVPESRGGSSYVHDELHAGTSVRVRGPRNNFALRPARRYLFVAGGIGVTPLLPMVAAAHAAGADWRLLYGGRTRSSMPFLDELEPYGDAVTIRPQDRHGLLDLAAYLGRPDDDTLVYCCGPEPLLAAAQDEPADTAFEVVLAQSGMTLQVPPERSVLEAARAAGVSVLYSCAEGICGTCETEVLEGQPDHRDSVLSDEERESGETMMICVSRSRSPRLVLDL
ncbi:PDR/VanB family oxidoreductase [Nonomuraea sp. NPDC026600]|uniref:PDR/VanB family oxidoreductase n=1 Tax=Nonomuraea sp. NPDC026600 TaxID=3155363 RepID=UPI0033C4457A